MGILGQKSIINSRNMRYSKAGHNRELGKLTEGVFATKNSGQTTNQNLQPAVSRVFGQNKNPYLGKNRVYNPSTPMNQMNSQMQTPRMEKLRKAEIRTGMRNLSPSFTKKGTL